MQQDNWGPHFVATSEASRILSGRILLKENVDEGLLRRDLDSMGLSGPVVQIMNNWYIRSVGQNTWLQVGTSDRRDASFPVLWDSASVANGDYEVLEQMNVVVKHGSNQQVVARMNTVKVAIQN